MKEYHFKSISEHNRVFGFPEPEHPLFCVMNTQSKNLDGLLECGNDFTLSTDFYSISIKRIISGEIFYGRTKYDCQNGTMIFTAPDQEISTRGIKVESEGRLILIHPDYIRSHPIYDQIKKYHFFDYAVHEALHLSPKEEERIKALFDSIDVEYHNNQDEFTKELILDLLTTLLRYSNRFYHRQFLARKKSENSLFQKFKNELGEILQGDRNCRNLDEI